jgi:AcrR family transcriptional regulator
MNSSRSIAITAVPPGGTGEAIRAAAVSLFAQRGYEATTMNDIGRSVGIRGSAIYNHVPSKQDLLRDIMVSAMEELVEGVESAIASFDDIPGQLRSGVRQHVLYHAQSGPVYSIGNREIFSLEEPSRSHLVEMRRSYVERFRGIIENGVATKLFSVTSPLLATHSILQAGMGVAVWFDPDGPMDGAEVGDLYGEFALRTVGYRG